MGIRQSGMFHTLLSSTKCTVKRDLDSWFPLMKIVDSALAVNSLPPMEREVYCLSNLKRVTLEIE